MSAAAQSLMRCFVLDRKEDATGTSGTGVVAEGVEFSNGQCAVHWLSQLETVTVYANSKVVERLHGHDGRTSVRNLDPLAGLSPQDRLNIFAKYCRGCGVADPRCQCDNDE